MQDKILNKSFQTKQNTTKEIIETNEMQTNLQKLHIQRKIWKVHNRNAICCILCV